MQKFKFKKLFNLKYKYGIIYPEDVKSSIFNKRLCEVDTGAFVLIAKTEKHIKLI